MNTPDNPRPLKRRRQQRSIETRNRIIRASLSEFAKFGFEGASTRGVAQAADVPHSLVLHHYSNKSELWQATVRETVGWYRDRVFPPNAVGTTAAARLRHYFAEYIRFSAEHPDFFRMITQENTLNSERLHWLMEQHSADNSTRIAALIAEAQAEGAVVEGDPLQLLYIFLGAAAGPYRSAAEMELLSGHAPNEPAQIDAHIRVCERLFFRDPDKRGNR